MNRRDFIKNTSTVIIGISAGCNSYINNQNPETPTTTSNNSPSEATDTYQQANEDFSYIIDVDTPIRENLELQTLPYEYWPQYTGYSPESAQLDEVPELVQYVEEGERGLHPLQTARLLIWLVEQYRTTEVSSVLDEISDVSDAITESSANTNVGLFLPYEFPHTHITDYHYPQWYSGMAQGTLLSAFSRAHYATGDEYYENLAHQVFTSLLVDGAEDTEGDPWVSRIDDNGYYWIEEYPAEPADHTLNGKIFALWGMYEYWQEFDVDAARVLMIAGSTTVKTHLDQYRRYGQPSLYCLKHEHVNKSYHFRHIYQLYKLYSITQDEEFRRYAILLKNDYNPDGALSNRYDIPNWLEEG